MNHFKGKYRFQYHMTKSLELISNDWLSIKERGKRLPQVEMDGKRPLLVLVAWYAARKVNVYKYAEIYLEKGFDVLIVYTSTRQLLLPLTGLLVSSSDIADFLNENPSYQPLLIHSFSIGCVIWSYTEEKISKNLEKYHNVIDRLAGCIWDSPPNGRMAMVISYLFFKKDGILRVISEQFVHLTLMMTYFLFYKPLKNAHYLIFNPCLKLPKLMLISKDDPYSQYKNNLAACDSWKSKGIQVHLKLWEKSRHVSHFIFHREEYLKQINLFLFSLGLSNIGDKQTDDRSYDRPYS